MNSNFAVLVSKGTTALRQGAASTGRTLSVYGPINGLKPFESRTLERTHSTASGSTIMPGSRGRQKKIKKEGSNRCIGPAALKSNRFQPTPVTRQPSNLPNAVQPPGEACEFCHKVYTTKARLRNHQRAKHGECMKEIEGAESLLSPYFRVQQKTAVLNAKSEEGPRTRSLPPPTPEIELIPDCEAIARAGKGFCLLCPADRCGDLPSLILHVQSHYAMRCQICGRSYYEREHLWEHVLKSLPCHLAINASLGNPKLTQSKGVQTAPSANVGSCFVPESEKFVDVNDDSDSADVTKNRTSQPHIFQSNSALTKLRPTNQSKLGELSTAQRIWTFTHEGESQELSMQTSKLLVDEIIEISDDEGEEILGTSNSPSASKTMAPCFEQDNVICHELPPQEGIVVHNPLRIEQPTCEQAELQSIVECSPSEIADVEAGKAPSSNMIGTQETSCNQEGGCKKMVTITERGEGSQVGSRRKLCKELNALMSHKAKRIRKNNTTYRCYMPNCCFETRSINFFCQHRIRVHGEISCSCDGECSVLTGPRPPKVKTLPPCSKTTLSLKNNVESESSILVASGNIATPSHHYNSHPDLNLVTSIMSTHDCNCISKPADHEQPDSTTNQDSATQPTNRESVTANYSNSRKSSGQGGIPVPSDMVINCGGCDSSNKRELASSHELLAGSLGQLKTNKRITKNRTVLEKNEKPLPPTKASSQPMFKTNKSIKSKGDSTLKTSLRKRKAFSPKPSDVKKQAAEPPQKIDLIGFLPNLTECQTDFDSRLKNPEFKVLVSMSKNVDDAEYAATIRVDLIEPPNQLDTRRIKDNEPVSWIADGPVGQYNMPSYDGTVMQPELPDLASMIIPVTEERKCMDSGDQPVTPPRSMFDTVIRDLLEFEQDDPPNDIQTCNISYTGFSNEMDTDCPQDPLQLDNSVTNDSVTEAEGGINQWPLNDCVVANHQGMGFQSDESRNLPHLENCQPEMLGTLGEFLSQRSSTSSNISQFGEEWFCSNKGLLPYDHNAVRIVHTDRVLEDVQKDPVALDEADEDPVSMSAVESSRVGGEDFEIDVGCGELVNSDGGSSSAPIEMSSATQPTEEKKDRAIMGEECKGSQSPVLFVSALSPSHEVSLSKELSRPLPSISASPNRASHLKKSCEPVPAKTLQNDQGFSDSGETKEKDIEEETNKVSQFENPREPELMKTKQIDLGFSDSGEETKEASELVKSLKLEPINTEWVDWGFSDSEGEIEADTNEASELKKPKPEPAKTERIDWGFSDSEEALQVGDDESQHSPAFIFGSGFDIEEPEKVPNDVNFASASNSKKNRNLIPQSSKRRRSFSRQGLKEMLEKFNDFPSRGSRNWAQSTSTGQVSQTVPCDEEILKPSSGANTQLAISVPSSPCSLLSETTPTVDRISHVNSCPLLRSTPSPIDLRSQSDLRESPQPIGCHSQSSSNSAASCEVLSISSDEDFISIHSEYEDL